MLILAVLAIFTAHLGLALGGTVVTIDAGKRFQTLKQRRTLGVSQAFGAASKFKALDPTPRQKGLGLLFNTTTGAGLSIIRNGIGSSKWSWDCIANTSPGSPDKPLDYHWDGVDSGQVWLSQEAMTYEVDTIYANAWSAPAYMKSAEHYGRLCGTRGVTCASGDWQLRYAQLITQYLTYYKEIGIPITHVGFLNEGDGSDFMLSAAEQAADVIPILHKTLESKGFSSVKITCCDNIGWKSQTVYTQKLAELGADKYLSVITSHAYSSDPKQPMNTTLPTWMTEGSDLRNAFGTAWYSTGALNEGFTWAVKIAEGIVNADLSAYVYWEGLEVNNAKSASHLIESDGSKVTPSSALWALAHWSHYIRPGAQRLYTSDNAQDTIIGAFENVDESIVFGAHQCRQRFPGC
ncbi:hypothetical protein NCS57_01181000 [Fusarium keratoplasticum]|uniref:Uncharacterized protein n=1 Tax=Fusarium keratoplasticum TaxID=1328300 RepID=A0ACC0QN45_9HYPO|nr:hypothetical protein NCS57_01181000 [Fusarium keratoplasticum]KAI8658006.1 hypothetical protein NCS57_01181000 [Fusarium keratoplasticum]